MTKPVGAKQRKPRQWRDSKHGKDPNYALTTFRKVKKMEKAKKLAEAERFNSLCGEVVVTKIEPTMAHMLEARIERQSRRGTRASGTNPRSLNTNPRSKQSV